MRLPLLAVVVLLVGCTSTSRPLDECGDLNACAPLAVCLDPADAAVRENRPPEAARVEGASVDLRLVVTSRSGPSERVVVRAGGVLLLDALLPAGHDYCGRPPTFTWSYDLPQRTVLVRVEATGQDAEVDVDLDASLREVVVLVDDEAPLSVEVPGWSPY